MSTSNEEKKTVTEALELITTCRRSVGERIDKYKTINKLYETGSVKTDHSLINRMYGHIDRLAGHIFCPEHIRFAVDFEHFYPKVVLDRANVAARILSKKWQYHNIDVKFGLCVAEALKYGCCFLKQYYIPGQEGKGRFRCRIVEPWAIGVYKEDETSLQDQPAFCESVYLSLPQVWQRIAHLPNADLLYRRIKGHMTNVSDDDVTNPITRNLFISSRIDIASQAPNNIPGGIINLGPYEDMPYLTSTAPIPMVLFHELWQWGGSDWITTQIIEPDILITRYKKGNILVPGDNATGLHPYTLVQPEETVGNIWGRSALIDIINPQMMLTSFANDIMKMLQLQIDKVVALIGIEGDPQEIMSQMKMSGFVNLGPGGDIKDLTPLPADALPILKYLNELIDSLGGFTPVLGGQGESGVRAGSHAEVLLKTASPRIRDMSLKTERQCAKAAELCLDLMRIKDDNYYWIDGEHYEETKFKLIDIPDDFSVSVDSHSSSAIFADDHQQLVAFGIKTGMIDPISAVELLPYPNKDLIIERLKEHQKQQQIQAEMLRRQDPEQWAKMMSHSGKK